MPDQVRADVEGSGDPPEALAAFAAWEEDENRAVTAWVEEHRGALPTDHDELVRLPSAYRLGVFFALPPESASALMQEHVRRSVAARPEMTEAQHAVILEAKEVFTVAWHVAPGDSFRGAGAALGGAPATRPVEPQSVPGLEWTGLPGVGMQGEPGSKNQLVDADGGRRIA